MNFNVFTFFTDFLNSLINVLQSVLEFFTTPVELGEFIFTPIDFMFGAGLIVVLGVILVKFLV